jgi:hypothetical protein
MRTSFHHQPEAQHPNSSAIHKLAGRLPPSLGLIPDMGQRPAQAVPVANDPEGDNSRIVGRWYDPADDRPRLIEVLPSGVLGGADAA